MGELQTDPLGIPVTDNAPSENEDEWIDLDVEVVEEHTQGQPGRISKSALNEVHLLCLLEHPCKQSLLCHGRIYLFLFSMLKSLSLDMIRWLVT
jgi:hypothetical protein